MSARRREQRACHEQFGSEDLTAAKTSLKLQKLVCSVTDTLRRRDPAVQIGADRVLGPIRQPFRHVLIQAFRYCNAWHPQVRMDVDEPWEHRLAGSFDGCIGRRIIRDLSFLDDVYNRSVREKHIGPIDNAAVTDKHSNIADAKAITPRRLPGSDGLAHTARSTIVLPGSQNYKRSENGGDPHF